jgi:hypothetical protein
MVMRFHVSRRTAAAHRVMVLSDRVVMPHRDVGRVDVLGGRVHMGGLGGRRVFRLGLGKDRRSDHGEADDGCSEEFHGFPPVDKADEANKARRGCLVASDDLREERTAIDLRDWECRA